MKKWRAVSRLAVFFTLAISISPHPADADDSTVNPYGVHSPNPYVVEQFVQDGETIDMIIVPGPPAPPPGFVRPEIAMLPVPNQAAGINVLAYVPASTWAFGCSATSAAMMFGYYDNSDFPNMYTGPTNGGLFPMTNASWGSVVINTETRALNPLSATRNGLDGRAINGHVDDYWIQYGSTASDPFITGSWTEHIQGECTGDYMGTNQYSFANSDGSTTFYNYTNGSPLYDYTGSEPSRRDGCHGMKLFAESRGYAVQSLGNFNQYIYGYNGNTIGFTFADFKAEIDAGRPVLIQVQGHTMLGFGYDDAGSTVYIHDTWDHADHTMTWGGSYSGMTHYGVTVCRLVKGSDVIVSSSEGVDFNGDGLSDIALWRPSNGYWFILGQGNTQWGANGDIPVPGDYNGDGRTDIAVWRPSNGYWFILGQGNTQWGANGDIPVPGDYNGDGRTDIAVWRPSNGYWFIQGQGLYQFGTNGDIPVPSDYDGNGTTDIAVWRPSNGYWFILGQGVYQYGANGDVPVPGDYNGDGLSDITVWRPSNGYWFVNGQGLYQWGANGDVPLRGDFDGNGQKDMTVWRPSNGYWFIRNQGLYQWGTNGDTPLD